MLKNRVPNGTVPEPRRYGMSCLYQVNSTLGVLVVQQKLDDIRYSTAAIG